MPVAEDEIIVLGGLVEMVDETIREFVIVIRETDLGRKRDLALSQSKDTVGPNEAIALLSGATAEGHLWDSWSRQGAIGGAYGCCIVGEDAMGARPVRI